MAFHDFRNVLDGRFEPVELFFLLSIQRDLNENVPWFADGGRIHQGHVAIDNATVFQGANPAQAGRFGESRLIGQLNIGKAAVSLQRLENNSVDAVDAGRSKIPHKFACFLEEYTENNVI
jgi:hypothetical protein